MTAEQTTAAVISKVGLWWPLAEQDLLRQAAAAYDDVAKAVLAATATGALGAGLVTDAVPHGKAVDAFDEHWATFAGRSRSGLPAASEAAAQVAAALAEFADRVEEAKHKITHLAIEIGATIAVGVGLSLLTFGATAVGAAARTAMLVARGWLIARGLSGMVATIVTTLLAGAVFGAVEGFLSAIVAQVGKVVLSDGDGIDLGEAVSWAGWGAVAGPVLAGVGLAARAGYRALRPHDVAPEPSGAPEPPGAAEPSGAPAAQGMDPPALTATLFGPVRGAGRSGQLSWRDVFPVYRGTAHDTKLLDDAAAADDLVARYAPGSLHDGPDFGIYLRGEPVGRGTESDYRTVHFIIHSKHGREHSIGTDQFRGEGPEVYFERGLFQVRSNYFIPGQGHFIEFDDISGGESVDNFLRDVLPDE